MPYAHRLRLRCIMEGIEVPIIACNYAGQANSPGSFQVQIPATDKAFFLAPRTLVHVFIWDYWQGTSATRGIRTASGGQVSPIEDALEQQGDSTEDPVTTGAGPQLLPTAEGEGPQTQVEAGELAEIPFIDEDENWKFLVGGEVIGIEFSKNASQRSIVLHCLDFSLYWDTAYQYKVNVASLTGDGMAAFVGAGTTFFDTFFEGETSTIVNAVQQRSITQPELTGLLSGIVRLLESVGGVYTGNESQSLNGANPQNIRHRFRGCNDFFSLAELRLKLVYMIAAAENDDSSRRQLAQQAFAMWGRRYASRLSQIASYREILGVVMQYIQHSVFPVVGPRYVHPQYRSRTRRRTVTGRFANTTQGRQILADLTALKNSLQYTINRMKYQTTDYPVESISAQLLSVNGRCMQLIARCNALGHSTPAERLQVAADESTRLRAIYQEGRGATSRNIYRANQMEINARAEDALSGVNDARSFFDSQTTSRTTESRYDVNAGERLNMQVIRPDIYMCSPPKCNVIFPELANSIQFSRTFMREVTRMRLTVSDEIFGADALLDQYYFAPDVEVMGALPPAQLRDGSMSGNQGRSLSRAAFSKRIMEHELYTGVVPVFERLNEINIYNSGNQEVDVRGLRIPYVMRAVNHQFFKHRWAQRQLSFAGKFNPYLVVGFPCVIIDRYMTRRQVELAGSRGIEYVERSGGEVRAIGMESPDGSVEGMEEEVYRQQYDAWQVLRETVPTQFIGMMETVQHSISHNSTSTSAQLSHVRMHREREELLGANVRQLNRRAVNQVRGRVVESRRQRRRGPGRMESMTADPDDSRARRQTTVAALEQPQVGMVGPNFGEIIEVVESSETGSFPLFGTYFGAIPLRRRRTYPVGLTLPAIDLGDEVVGQVGDPLMEVTLHAYSIVELIDRFVGQEVEVPIEDFLRPPWMSDVWKRDRIGRTYEQFFGIGAITDSTAITTQVGHQTSAAQADPVEEALAAAEAERRRLATSDPIQQDGRTVIDAGLEITVERAIDLLVRSYSAIRHNNLDVHEFIRAYTWRPMATLVNILGSRDLELDASGRVVSGIEGLHSRAFGHGELGRNLRNLVDEDVRQILGFNIEQDRGQVLERMDKRAEKAAKVAEYMRELEESRGLLG